MYYHPPACILHILDDFFVGAGDVNEPQKLVAAASADADDTSADDKDVTLQAEVEKREIEHQIQDRPMMHTTQAGKILTDQDNELEIVQRVLETVHSIFYSKEMKQDSRDIMMQMRANVLDGCVIVFSSLIPLGIAPQEYLGRLFSSFKLLGMIFG